MTNLVLENEFLRVEVSPLGAEMHSIWCKRTGCEQLWQGGDPKVWKDHAPWLFPLIGQLKDDHYLWQGKAYTMPMHGFASGKEFSVVEASPKAVTLRLEDTPETLTMYPFRFTLNITYTLEGESLKVKADVTPRETDEIYVSLGAHPGFYCQEGDVLELNAPAPLQCRRLCLSNHLLQPGAEAFAPDKLVLKGSLFDNDAMLLENPDMEGVTLTRHNGTKVEISFTKVPWLGIWSRTGAGLPYICVEPWYGVDDPIDADGRLEKKLGIERLKRGEHLTLELGIRSIPAVQG